MTLKTPPEISLSLPDELKEARLKSGLTQAQAAKLVYRTTRHWQHMESGDRAIDPAVWELFQIKVITNKSR